MHRKRTNISIRHFEKAGVCSCPDFACTKMKAHPVGELRLLGKPGRLNELCFCAALNCRF